MIYVLAKDEKQYLEYRAGSSELHMWLHTEADFKNLSIKKSDSVVYLEGWKDNPIYDNLFAAHGSFFERDYLTDEEYDTDTPEDTPEDMEAELQASELSLD